MSARAVAFPAPGHTFRFSTLAHAGSTILGPMLPAELDAIVHDALGALLAHDLAAGTTALDIGCGKGDLLVRLARQGVHSTGLDRNPWFIADAAALVARARVGALVELRTADANDESLQHELDIVVCVGATDAIGGPVSAPLVIAQLLRPGGVAVIGEAFWRTPPPLGAAEAFGIGPDEMVDRDATVARVAAAGLEPLAVRLASQRGWDAYEDEYSGAIERWMGDHPGDPDRAPFLGRTAMMRTTWTTWRREAMGFAVVVARRPEG